MAMTVRQTLASACLALGAMGIAPATAQTADPSPILASPEASLFAQPVDSEVLSGVRGRAQVRNSMTLDGVTADNSARNVNTGSNRIDSGSFANMSGLPIVVQNSGANVLIQNAVILNVTMD
jgi:hypothetical protein